MLLNRFRILSGSKFHNSEINLSECPSAPQAFLVFVAKKFLYSLHSTLTVHLIRHYPFSENICPLSMSAIASVRRKILPPTRLLQISLRAFILLRSDLITSQIDLLRSFFTIASILAASLSCPRFLRFLNCSLVLPA